MSKERLNCEISNLKLLQQSSKFTSIHQHEAFLLNVLSSLRSKSVTKYQTVLYHTLRILNDEEESSKKSNKLEIEKLIKFGNNLNRMDKNAIQSKTDLLNKKISNLKFYSNQNLAPLQPSQGILRDESILF